MINGKTQNKFILALEKKFLKEMPRIRKEIKVYEIKRKNGRLSKLPKSTPQFSS